jgi:hypothetical protein
MTIVKGGMQRLRISFFLLALTQMVWKLSYFSELLTLWDKSDGSTIASVSTNNQAPFCALNVTGNFGQDGNFIPDDTSCPWVIYAGKVLCMGDNASTPEELRQNEISLGRQKRNIVLVGESQERNVVEHLCATTPGSIMRVFPPRWTLPSGEIQEAPPSVPNSWRESYRLSFRACSYENLTVASFFHFGFITANKWWAKSHTSEGEPKETLDRIENVLPKYLDDVFGKGYSLDAIVINSGLWDLHGISFSDHHEEQLKSLNQTNNSWHFQGNKVAESLERQFPTTPIVWRNMPTVHEEVSRRERKPRQKISPFELRHVELMNEVGISFAKSRNWPILDWRGPLLPLGASALKPDGFHVGVVGWNLFLNRILNAVMDEHWKG